MCPLFPDETERFLELFPSLSHSTVIQMSEKSRRLWLFLGFFGGFPGRLRETNFGKLFPT